MNTLILFVGDDPTALGMLSDFLECRGMDVDVLDGGRSLIRYMKQDMPSLIVLRDGAPNVQATAVLQTLHNAGHDTPVIVIGNPKDAVDAIICLELGAEDFISWPVNPSELVARIRARVRSSRPLTELRTVLEKQNRQIEVNRQNEAATQYELEQARLVQQRFVTNVFPEGRGLEFANRYRPSRHVGGDLFDVVAVNSGEVALLMADISGHGVPAGYINQSATAHPVTPRSVYSQRAVRTPARGTPCSVR